MIQMDHTVRPVTAKDSVASRGALKSVCTASLAREVVVERKGSQWSAENTKLLARSRRCSCSAPLQAACSSNPGANGSIFTWPPSKVQKLPGGTASQHSPVSSGSDTTARPDRLSDQR